eukprot:PITA_32111
MKWVEELPTFWVDGETVMLFLFNQVMCRFGVPCMIITDHGSHFQNHMMSDLTLLLGFRQDQSSSYYPQANGQVEAVSGVLKTMIFKTVTSFTLFQLAYGLEAVLPTRCQIPSLQIAIELLLDTIAEEERLLYLNQLDETRRDAELALEAHKHRVKAQYDKMVKPRSYREGDRGLLYDKKHDLLGAGTLQPLWIGPYVIKKALSKWAYEIQDWEGAPLAEP